jgi:acyl carrier protein
MAGSAPDEESALRPEYRRSGRRPTSRKDVYDLGAERGPVHPPVDPRSAFHSSDLDVSPSDPSRTRPGGSTERFEDGLRRLVADEMGVDPAELTPDVSLTDDLAADSLDLVLLVLLLETELAVTISEHRMQQVRTYGDLAALVATVRRESAGAHADLATVFARTRVVPGAARPNRPLERSGLLTPYAAQLIAEDALHAGAGSVLEMDVSAATHDDGVTAARDTFGWLADRGVRVIVRRDLPPARPAL